MSFRVVAKVLRESDEKLARRLILLVLAEAASDDGIAWVGQEEIAEKARLSRTHVAERIVEMRDDGAIELRKAKRGRRRINVYRLVLEGLDEPDYDRLPFVLDEPFTTSEVPTPSATTTSDPPGDGVGSSESTASDPPTPRARDPLSEPSEDPPGDPGAASLASLAPSQSLVALFVDEARARGSDPPRRVVGAVARNVKQLLDEGRGEEEVAAGLRLMLDRGLANAALLPQFVAEAQLTPRPRKREDAATRAARRAVELEAQGL